MSKTMRQVLGYRRRCMRHVAPVLGALLMSLCLGCAEATNDSLGTVTGSRQAPVRASESAPSSAPIDVRWLIGEWQLVHDPSEIILIEHTALGQYAMSPTKQDSRFTKGTLSVLQIGCHRIAEVRWDAQQADNVGYAVLNGYAYRLSLDFVPAIFLGAWRDPELLESLGLGADQEVPPEMRDRAITWFAEQIDAKGTLLYQDMTFYRPGTLD